MFIDKNGVVRRPKAYLAGFEMFYPDGIERGEQWKKIAAKYGIEGIFPPDAAPENDPIKPYVRKDDSEHEFWYGIFMDDVNHMRRSDMIIAQLEDWRGAQPDSGTAFECGYAAATGLRLYAWCSDTRDMPQRRSDIAAADEDGVLRDSDGYAFEQRDFPQDNMFSCMKIASSFEEACKMARADFDAELIAAGHEPFPVED